MKVKNDHRSKFSNLTNWKEEAWKNQGFNGIRTPLKPWFFQASSFQLLKLENLLRWSFFTFNNRTFVNHSYDYRPNWTPLGPITIINIGNRTSRRPIQSGLTNQTPASRSSDFVNHSYNYRTNWSPLGPITIRNRHVETNYDQEFCLRYDYEL